MPIRHSLYVKSFFPIKKWSHISPFSAPKFERRKIFFLLTKLQSKLVQTRKVSQIVHSYYLVSISFIYFLVHFLNKSKTLWDTTLRGKNSWICKMKDTHSTVQKPKTTMIQFTKRKKFEKKTRNLILEWKQARRIIKILFFFVDLLFYFFLRLVSTYLFFLIAYLRRVS